MDTAKRVISIIGKATRVAALKAEYSASKVDRAHSVWRYDFQIRGQGPRKIIKPVRDLAEVVSSGGSIL